MKKYSGFARWGPAAGMLAVGMLAFSLSLEGAAPSPQQPTVMKEKVAGDAPVAVPADGEERGVATRKATERLRSRHSTVPVNPEERLPEGIKFGRVQVGNLPILASQTVDYRDDAGTRLRQAGLLVGPYRPGRGADGAVAGGGPCEVKCTGAGVPFDCCTGNGTGPTCECCSFNIDCDDCNDCSNDFCNIVPGNALGTGVCENDLLPNGAEGGCSDGVCCNGRETCQSGVCEAPGAGTGTFDPGGCEFPCSGGNVCNESTAQCRLPCTGAGTCAISGGVCQSTPDCPTTPEGNYCLNCSDGVACNGVETCVAQRCVASVNPCGPGATCGERDCSAPGLDVCTSDSDCQDNGLGTCNKPGPICFPGRCCNNSTAEPSCTKRFKSSGTCTGGSNPGGACVNAVQCRICTTGTGIGTPCTVNANCPGGGTCGSAGTCTVTASCDSQGGVWYASDNGDLPPVGTICPTPAQEDPANERTLCPKYSSGIAPQVLIDPVTNEPVASETSFVVFAISNGPCDHSDIGDDYHIENGSPIAMEKFRWIGGGGGRLLVEFYDASGNFIEDVVTGGISGANAVRSLNFLPPLTVPADGYIVISVPTPFAANGRTFVTTTDNVDEGTNLASGPNSLWLDGGPTSISLRECVGGTNDGDWCDPDDLGDTECVGAGGVCTVRNNRLSFEIEGIKSPAPTGACCNDISGACTDGVISWVCAAQGNNYQGDDSICAGPCTQGACCAADGTCSETTSGLCVGTFSGAGTDCDPNCCVQPDITGGDNCEDVVEVRDITVPDPGDPAIVETFTGNNTGVTGPDSCLQGSWNAAGGTYLTVDPGWWEAFRIDACAFVRLDFCCSNPTIEPQWNFLWEGCPCDDARGSAVNPNNPDEPATKRGEPYCQNGDDNLWLNYGPLHGRTCSGGSGDEKACTVAAECPGGNCTGGVNPGAVCLTNVQCRVCVGGGNDGDPCTGAGDCPLGTCPAGGTCTPATCTEGHTYYVPIYSIPSGGRGQYQMHLTVEACPTAACCNGTSCIVTDQLGCAAVDGANFLAPPFRTTATVGCQAATCATGSCCYVPNQGLCQDIISGQLATLALCNSANGDYQGGARCAGCVCAVGGATAASCNDDADCGANGPCNNPGGGLCSGQNITQPSPCPVCDFESNSRCQKQPGYDGARLSDLCAGNCISGPPESVYSLPGIRAADDFVASVNGSITSVCVWGAFLLQGSNLIDCGDGGPPEKFTVRLYNDNGGLPSSEVGVRTTTVVRKDVTAPSPPAGRTVYQWQLALSSPLPVVGGNTYWLEIVNDTDESSGDVNCDWFWALSDPDQGPDSGNQYILQDQGDVYAFGDAAFDGADLAWCVNVDNTVPAILEAACCKCGGGVSTCDVLKLEDCINADGSWSPSEPDCIGVDCRETADAADNCSTDKVAVGTNSNTPWNNYCATTDGPAQAGNGDCPASNNLQFDLWYTYTATCTGDVVVETCDRTVGEINTMMAIYTAGTGTCVCPTDATLETDCNNEGCVFTGAGSRITIPAVSGVCYTIRIGGVLGARGEGTLHVSGCDVVDPQPIDLSADPIPALKTRFISFSATGGTGETAIRATLTTLHDVVPGYTGGTATNFDQFETKSMWVGPPSVFQESGANPTPYKTASLQCSPHYRDWNSEGLVHVTGGPVVPSSIYHLENVASACQGIEGTAGCAFGTQNVSANRLPIGTTRWADVETPYAPGTAGQPAFSDVTALVAKFRSQAGSPIKARALILGNDAHGRFNTATLSADLNFSHIASCVDAFRGVPYPFKLGKCTGNPTAPSSGACAMTSECIGTNGAGPCILDSVGQCTGAPTPPATGVCRWDSQCTGTNGTGPCVITNCAP